MGVEPGERPGGQQDRRQRRRFGGLRLQSPDGQENAPGGELTCQCRGRPVERTAPLRFTRVDQPARSVAAAPGGVRVRERAAAGRRPAPGRAPEPERTRRAQRRVGDVAVYRPTVGGVSSTACPGCDGTFLDVDGPVHRYMTSSGGCWRGFGEVLADDYSSPERMKVHQLVVDAYAAQHPGDGSLLQQVQSVGLHLMTLCLFVEQGADPALGTALHRRMVRRPTFTRLERSGPGALTWQHMPKGSGSKGVRDAAYGWGQAVWATYEDSQPTVRTWLREAGFDLSDPVPSRPL